MEGRTCRPSHVERDWFDDAPGVTAACGVVPYRPILDIATPCAVRSFVDDLPTVVTTEKVKIYPRPRLTTHRSKPVCSQVTETQHKAGYVSDGGMNSEQEIAKICPPDPIKCKPIATGFCAKRDTFGRKRSGRPRSPLPKRS